MRRTSRRWIAVVTLLGMLGLQGALAAHACAMAFLPSDGAHAAAPSAHCAAMAPTPAPQGGALCLEHCTKGKEATTTVAATDAPLPLSVAIITVPASAAPAVANSWSPPQLDSRNNSPPGLASSTRLRI